MKTRYGTSHFVSNHHAVNYYQEYGLSYAEAKESVKYKLSNGEIHIGPPKIDPNQTLHINKEGRYEITTNN